MQAGAEALPIRSRRSGTSIGKVTPQSTASDRAKTTSNRCDLNEMAASLLTEVRKHGLREDNNPEKIGLDLCPDLFDARVFDGRDVAIPRVIHKDIKFAEGLDSACSSVQHRGI